MGHSGVLEIEASGEEWPQPSYGGVSTCSLPGCMNAFSLSLGTFEVRLREFCSSVIPYLVVVLLYVCFAARTYKKTGGKHLNWYTDSVQRRIYLVRCFFRLFVVRINTLSNIKLSVLWLPAILPVHRQRGSSNSSSNSNVNGSGSSSNIILRRISYSVTVVAQGT